MWNGIIVFQPLAGLSNRSLFLVTDFLVLERGRHDRFEQSDQCRELRLRHPVDQFMGVLTSIAHRFQHSLLQVYYVGELYETPTRVLLHHRRIRSASESRRVL